MILETTQIKRLLHLVRSKFPDWDSFSHPLFMKEEVNYKQATVRKATAFLNETELRQLLENEDYDTFIERIEAIGTDNNLLYRSIPMQGDLNILYQPDLDREEFCKAFVDLIHGRGESPERLARYCDFVETHNLPSKWTFPTYFLFICHPDKEMFVKPRSTQAFLKLLGCEDVYSRQLSATTYAAILDISRSLAVALDSFGPRDMVDIQGFMWVCANAETNPQDFLAEPLSKFFQNRADAEKAFDLLKETFNLLGIVDENDARLALTLPKQGHVMRLNYGNWAIISFQQHNLERYEVEIALLDKLADFDGEHIRGEWSFADQEPSISSYSVPFGALFPMSDGLRAAYTETMQVINRRFKDWIASTYRRAHVPELVTAVFDPQKRMKLLDQGLPELSTDEISPPTPPPPEINPVYTVQQCAGETYFDVEDIQRWLRSIERKGQAVFYGPPGTGKTYIAERLARHLIGGGDGFVDLVQFHPAYAYEDFIQGIRPEIRTGGGLGYCLAPGRFLEFCSQASNCNDRCVLIIDEINRANLARVFGELMYLLEYRDRGIPLAGGGVLNIPSNVRIIGTMNTADRSIALVDHALRRRFAFLPLFPNTAILSRFHKTTGFPVDSLIATLERLNHDIDDPNYQVGVSFFLLSDLSFHIGDIWQMEIEPYLEEFFFDQPEKVDNFRWEKVKKSILG